MRNDFDKATKDILAKRVGFCCSNPNCGQLTSGPQKTKNKSLNIGVAAHITAASKDGPRYVSKMVPDERESIENGIWLCQNCAKLIDNDKKRYPIRLLQKWKELAENTALLRIEERFQPSTLSPEFNKNTKINKKDGSILVYIKPGVFTMGLSIKEIVRYSYSENTSAESECIPHVVHLDGFWIGKFPITNKQYKRFIEETGYRQIPERLNDPLFNADNHPVIGVSWEDAQTYLKWAGLRLPTEAEWERAAREPGKESMIFPWGNDMPNKKLLNYARNNANTTPVSEYFEGATPNTEIMDLSGNVLEWCLDDARCYTPKKVRNPIGPLGRYRVIRGGSFVRPANCCRSAFRDRRVKETHWGSTGFRPVLGGAYNMIGKRMS